MSRFSSDEKRERRRRRRRRRRTTTTTTTSLTTTLTPQMMKEARFRGNTAHSEDDKPGVIAPEAKDTVESRFPFESLPHTWLMFSCPAYLP